MIHGACQIVLSVVLKAEKEKRRRRRSRFLGMLHKQEKLGTGLHGETRSGKGDCLGAVRI